MLGAALVPHAARRILKDALTLRDQRDEDIVDAAQFDLKIRDLNQRTDRLLQMRPTHEPNRRLLGHLRNEREHLFTFLTKPGVQATNWRAEQALRPTIVNRRNWGGNRTAAGARTQQIAIGVIRTARQQNLDPLDVMIAAQHNPTDQRADHATRPRIPTTSGAGRVSMTPDPFSELRYRIVCYELDAETKIEILDTTARGYIIIAGTIDPNGTVHARGSQAGPITLRRRLAALIADDEQLTG
jgi:hypothetical protein